MTPGRRDIDDLARALPRHEPSPERERRTRDAIVGAARRPRLPRRRVAVLAAGAAAVLIAAGAWWLASAPGAAPSAPAHAPAKAASPAPAPAVEGATRYRGAVVAGARADLSQRGEPGHEIVRVREGEVTFDVAPLARGELFEVVTDDAVVRVAGTRFTVAVAADRLASVSVHEGRVVLTVHGEPAIALGPGDSWDAVRTPPRAAVEPARASSAPPRPRERRGEAAFVDGWHRLQAGKPAAAAPLFARACRVATDDALAHDACFWRAVALHRAGEREAAATAALAFFARWPDSSRAGELRALVRPPAR